MDTPELIAADKSTPKFSLSGVTCRAKCVSVYDGDTAQFVFNLPSGNNQLYRFSCRMLGYNSAEIKSRDEAEKTQAVKSRDALSGKILGKCVTLRVGEFDKYGRPLVTVELDGEIVNDWMVENNFGKPYTGAGEKQW